ncbi:(S)-2-hydroxy-acid oxidase [Drepanopeziza brunnea f. sp. 'multigermtubi' MB_m1]|uniref:alpha-galactosidase n=1 Tax=Marssonina brunnea f. sp. multigermtubi (strain MB_m1) TaxID=1072389 RepID=K1WLK0_MARBU|nr:(S)-2-hydroxy-acid oxidase [Drepanopeziza brunnea f. sp. 'multigermtubi' MB_m1]EKD13107.1 (S)-2-hydroxy-acid oxidase [Drepanopeziza brunnea f. sp. 'multigermtubi' MB_m1]
MAKLHRRYRWLDDGDLRRSARTTITAGPASRYASDAPGWRERSARMLAGMMCAMTSTLFMYQGQEIGMINKPKEWNIGEYKDLESIKYYSSVADRTDNDPEALAHVMKSLQIFQLIVDYVIGYFEWAARKTLDVETYTQFQYRAAGEWTSILGFKFSAPFFISPCASAGMISPVAERGLVGGAVLEMKAFFICVLNNIAAYVNIFQEIEQMGAKAIAITVNSAGDPRPAACDAMRYPPNVNLDSVQRWAYTTWDYDRGLQSLTPLPIFSKGIETIEDARRAGRALDVSPSLMEIAMEIFEEDPEVVKQVEVYAHPPQGRFDSTDNLECYA